MAKIEKIKTVFLGKGVDKLDWPELELFKGVLASPNGYGRRNLRGLRSFSCSL